MPRKIKPIDMINPQRRAILRSMGAVGAGGVVGSATLSGRASATRCRIPESSGTEDEESYEWAKDDSAYYEHKDGSTYHRLTEIQSAVVYKGSDYSNTQERWFHHFRTGGYSKTMRKRSWEDTSDYSFIKRHDYVKVLVENTDTTKAILWGTSHPDAVGITAPPDTGSDLNESKAVYTVMVILLSRANPKVATFITAYSIIAALYDTDEEDSGSIQDFLWDYDWNSGPCEAGHWCRFIMESRDGYTDAECRVENTATYDGHGGAQTNYNVYVDAAPCCITASSVEHNRDHPEPGEPGYSQYLVKQGLAKKIPYEDIQDPVSRQIAQGRPIYRATRPIVNGTSFGEKIYPNSQ